MLNNDISKELHTNFIEYAVAVNVGGHGYDKMYFK